VFTLHLFQQSSQPLVATQRIFNLKCTEGERSLSNTPTLSTLFEKLLVRELAHLYCSQDNHINRIINLRSQQHAHPLRTFTITCNEFMPLWFKTLN
jgi:hypothetical protein